MKFNNQVQVRYLFNTGKESCNYVDQFLSLRDEELTTLPFTVNLMTCAISLDMSRKELFYKSYWTCPMQSNEVLTSYQ